MDLNLDEIRKEIDDIDKSFTAIFERRMDLVLQVAKFKEENNQKIFDSDREKKVIDKNKNYLKNKEYEKSLEDFYNDVMSISRKFQAKKIFESYKEDKPLSKIDLQIKNIKEPIIDPIVGFQGVPGAYSEEALLQYFGDKTKNKNFKEFEDVFEGILSGKIDYGVLPIENSSTGCVTEVYDLMRNYDCSIVGELSLKVNHNLLGIKGSSMDSIKRVYSHPQGLRQSTEFIKKHGLETHQYRNTADSAKYIKGLNSIENGAIAGCRASKIYDLDIIASNINFNDNNYTKFAIIRKCLEVSDKSNKVSIVFSAPHKPGALYGALSYFAENNLNMIRIESRPVVGMSWQYFFYIDFEGNLLDENLEKAIKEIESKSTFFKLLGNYRGYIGDKKHEY